MLRGRPYEAAEEMAFKEVYRTMGTALGELGCDSGVLGAAAFALDETRKTG